MAEPLLLPDTRLKEPKGAKLFNGINWIPIFCANCGADGGLVPEQNCNFAFYLCPNCAEVHGNIEGTYMEPDAVFWEKVKNEQLEKYGRELTAEEIVEFLKDDNHPLTKLCKDRPDFRKD
jgi:hypothetical protein